MNREGRDDAAEIDRAFADIMSRWGETAHRDESGSTTPADATPDAMTDEQPPPVDSQATEPRTAEARATEAHAADAETTGSEATESDTIDSPNAPPPVVDNRPDQPRRPRTVEEVFGSRPDAPDTAWRVHTPPEDVDDDFVPPRPAPPSGNDVTFWLALVGIVGGPLWIIYLAVAAPYSSRLWLALAITATLAGFALMVMRLPARRDPESDDDGAVV